jgi:hypothetical protein
MGVHEWHSGKDAIQFWNEGAALDEGVRLGVAVTSQLASAGRGPAASLIVANLAAFLGVAGAVLPALREKA